jgi:hypothetical protein
LGGNDVRSEGVVGGMPLHSRVAVVRLGHGPENPIRKIPSGICLRGLLLLIKSPKLNRLKRLFSGACRHACYFF